MSVMALVIQTCVALTCDRCGDGWADLDAEPHFGTRAEATRYATGAGWAVTHDRAVCPDCIPVELCGLAGHRWGPWTPVGPFPDSGGVARESRARYCRGCTYADWDPPRVTRKRDDSRRAG